jgi:hypothetical protein
MKLDLYTKSILTLIAIALVLLCVQNAVSPRIVAAQPSEIPQKVILDGVSTKMGPLDVNILAVGNRQVDRTVPVIHVRVVK